MSVTIDSLDIQIRSSAGSAAANIDRLADALGRMRANAKLTAVTNNLNKLSDALGRLQGTSTGLSNIRGLAGAMKSLSQIQNASGFNSLVNTLKKLPDIVNQLDASTLATFAARMRQLATALAPLASQIDKVGVAFSRLPARVSQIVTATQRMSAASRDAAAAQDDHNDSINAMSLNLATGIANLESFLGVLHQVRDALVSAISTAIEWDGIQFRFGQAFGDDAQEVYDWILKINDALGISVQEFMQNSGMYASLLKGFGVEQEKASDIALGLTELTYDIWAFNNDRYKQLEEAAEAVRSAITGEIEPIRNAGIALTEASMQEYLDSIGMAHVSMEKLTEAQKAEVRYAVMVNSAMSQGIVGTYAREMDTAEGAVRRLTQQLKTLIQAFGSLFIPILQKVIPWITAFVSILTDAVHWVAAFFGIKITEIDWSKTTSGVDNLASGAKDANAALDGAADSAKKLKTYTMGFDELNVIDPPSDSGGGGAAGGAGAGGNGFPGLDVDSLWDQALLDSASKKVDEIKQKILDFFEKWKNQIQIIAAALGVLGLSKLLGHLGQAFGLGEKFLGVMKTIGKLATTAIIITIQYSLMTELLSNFIETGEWKNLLLAGIVGAIGTGILYSMWGPAGLVIGLGVTAVASLSAIIENGGITNVESAVVALGGLASAIAALGIAWKKVMPVIKGSNLVQLLIGLKNGSAAANSALTFMFPNFFKFTTAVSSAAKAVGTFVAGLTAGPVLLIAGIIGAIVSVAIFLKRNWEEVTTVVKDFFATNIAPKLEEIKGHFQKIGEVLAPVGQKIKEIFANTNWSEFIDGIGVVLKSLSDFAEFVGGAIFAVVGSVIAGVFNAAVKAVEGFVQVISGIVQIVTGVVTAIVKIFQGDLPAAWEAVKEIGRGIADVFGGLWDMVVGALDAFVQGVIDFFVGLWDELVGHSIVPDTIDGIVESFTSLPGKLYGFLENFVTNVIQFFKNLWTGITTALGKVASWFQEKFEAAKTAVHNAFSGVGAWFGQRYTDIKSSFASVADWFREKFNAAFDNVKKVFDIETWKSLGKDALDGLFNGLSNLWDKAKTWGTELLDNVKSVLGIHSPSKEFEALAFYMVEGMDKGFLEHLTLEKLMKKVMDQMYLEVDEFHKKLQAIIQAYSQQATALVNQFFSWFKSQMALIEASVKNGCGNMANAYRTMAQGATSAIAGIISMLNAIPTSITTVYTIQEEYIAAEKPASTATAVQKFASGGVIEDGLFTMNHGEIAGRFGNGQSVVANNQQIVEGIASGVYQAVVSAMSATGGRQDQNVNVYLDGKQIYASVKKTESERGRTLMGHQLGYMY